MKKITIDGLELDEKKIEELKKWFEENSFTGPAVFFEYIQIIQKNMMRMWRNLDDTPEWNAQMKDSIDMLFIIEESMKKLM